MDTCLNIPVLQVTDFAILGGGLAAVSAALTLADRGNRVTLVIKESFLLEDICLPHLFFNRSGSGNHPMYERIFDKFINHSAASLSVELYHPDRLKLHAEDLLKKSGIDYFYCSVPLDSPDINEGKLLRIAGKFGVNGIKCKKIIDLRSSAYEDRFILDAMNAPEDIQEQIITIADMDEPPFEVILRPGPYGNGHITLDIPCDGISSEDGFERSYIQRKRAMQILRIIKEIRPDLSSLESARFAQKGYSSLYHPLKQISRGIESAVGADKECQPYRETNPKEENTHILPEGLYLVSHNELVSETEMEACSASTPKIQELKKYDVVVVGGGTSGVMAAVYAARQGVKTVLIEFNHILGGTGTIGGVSSYWFGKRFNDTLEVDERIQRLYEALGLVRKPGIWGRYDDFNPDIKSFVLMEMCRDAGVEVLTGTVSFAAVSEKESGGVCGVAASTGNKTIAALGRYVIDATGDGDIAAFAKACHTYGSERDSVTYWASLAQYTSPAKYKNNFSSAVMVNDLKDYTRFISSGRRLGEGIYDHGAYVAPRESRHIKGLYEVTLQDASSFREYSDTIYTCFSNFDPKGKLNADMVYVGVLPPQNSIAVPLRAVIPVNKNNEIIGGLVIAGKAVSCTHNAFPGMRMQPDIQHQGAVLGLLTAEAVKKNASLLELDIRMMQDKIRTVTGDPLHLRNKNIKEPGEWADSLDANTRLDWTGIPFGQEIYDLPPAIAIMTAPDNVILPYLEKRFLIEKSPEIKLILARFMIWHGSDKATELLLGNIMDELENHEELPVRMGSTACVQLLPDHGAMAEQVYSLNVLAWSKRSDIFKPFQIVLERLSAMKRDYCDIRKSYYHYIEAFAYVAERTVLPQFIPMIKSILNFQELRRIPDNSDILSERFMILRLSLLRALARCGDKKGYEGLAELLENSRASVARSALMELKVLTERDFGVKTEAWRNFIHSEEFCPGVIPITKKVW